VQGAVEGTVKGFGSICAAGLAAVLLLIASGDAAIAEQAWVRGEIRLNIRTGPGHQYRIIGLVKTGDAIDVLERGEEWTKIQVRGDDGSSKQGWIPGGYLNSEPPPTVQLERAQSRVATLEEELGTLKSETGKLRSDNEILTSQDGDQQSQIKQLTMENMELRAGARYPEWITGASIFAAGMVLGAWLHRNSARRQPTRIRL